MAIGFDVHGAVVVITIDRVEKMNALDDEHSRALTDAFKRYECDDRLRCAVVTGAGSVSFCAGADLDQLIPQVRGAVRRGESPEWEFGGLTGSSLQRKPTIAAVGGYALAGGLEIALACDIRIATPSATFGLAETKWAIIPGAGGTQRLPRAIPLGPAMEMILSGEPIGAADALRWGLVNRVVGSDVLLETAVSLAESISAKGPLAVRAARQAVLEGLGRNLDDGLAIERELFFGVLRTEDAVEGTCAFAERRPPLYRGV